MANLSALDLCLFSLFLFQFAHDLCDIYWATGCQFCLLFLFLLSQNDGTQTGPPPLSILLQLGITD